MARVITELHPGLQEKVHALAAECQKQGLIIGIGECLRTVAEQEALYAQGRTVPGNIVTNARGSSYSSQHQWGIAFDFYRNDGTGAYNEEGRFFEKVGAIGKSAGLGWGGDWTSLKDRPHLYLPDWGSTTAKLKSQYGTPNKFMAAWGNGVASAPASVPASSADGKSDFIKEIQSATGAKVDGIAGPETLSKTVTVSMAKNSRHDVVKPIQKRFNSLGYDCGTADGIAGIKFDTAAKAFQKANGCICDGELTAGKLTWRKILGMA